MYYYNAKNAADDWLISPGINLKGGKTLLCENLNFVVYKLPIPNV